MTNDTVSPGASHAMRLGRLLAPLLPGTAVYLLAVPGFADWEPAAA